MGLERIRLSLILNYGELLKLFKHFSVVTGLDVVLYDIQGNEELAYRRRKSVCSFVKDRTKCIETIKYGAEKARELGEPYIYQTACGLIMCSFPIVFGGELIGSVSCGPAKLWEADDFAEKEFYGKLKSLGIENTEEIDIKDIKYLECVNMTSSAEMLRVLVDYIVTEEQKNILQKKEIAKLNAEREKILAEIDSGGIAGKYPLELEKELIAYVHLGNSNKARGIINNYLNEIFSYACGNMDIIKAKLYEFTAFLSRAAVEAGADLKNLSKTVKKSAAFLSENIEFQDLCTATIEILESFISIVYNSRGNRLSSRHLAKAAEYIGANYGSDISLDTVSKSVFVSSYYLSHLFRDEMNTTFTDYLTKIRIDKAKELLDGTRLSVEEISEKTGFKDGNYFIRTFKKHVGLTPAAYRKGTK